MIMCITGPFLVVILMIKRIHRQDEELAFIGDERRRINEIARRRRQETSFAKENPNKAGGRNYHRQEVIKGTITNSITDYPYTVSLLNKDSRNEEWHVCGGTLITRNTVLSAAHCRDHVKTAKIGIHNTDHVQRRNQFKENLFEDRHRSTFRSGWKDTRYQRRKIQYQRRKTIELSDQSFIMHPDYDPATGENDFMLILLPESFHGTPFPRLNSDTYVPNAYRTEKDKRVVVLGWGITQDGDANSASEVLLKANLDYVNNYECGWAYGAQHIKTNMLCAHSNSGLDACNGDSGGPLIMQHEDGPAHDLLVGVVSWGATCGSSKYPGVYARLSSAYRWINDVTCNDLSPESCEENEISIFREKEVPSQQPSPGPSKSPTGKSICTDFVGRFYITKKNAKIRDCRWVGKAKFAATLWYRCRWFKYYCPNTCGRCPKN